MQMAQWRRMGWGVAGCPPFQREVPKPSGSSRSLWCQTPRSGTLGTHLAVLRMSEAFWADRVARIT